MQVIDVDLPSDGTKYTTDWYAVAKSKQTC